MDVRDEDVRGEDEDEAEQDEQHLGPEVDDREDDVELRRLLDADDVDDDEDGDHDDRRRRCPTGSVRSGPQKTER